MTSMPPVICNAGPLMALGKLNRLDVLNHPFQKDKSATLSPCESDRARAIEPTDF